MFSAPLFSVIHSLHFLQPVSQRLMTCLTVPLPLPKASVEYTWVQLHKLLLSALKSVGSPTQQMGRGCPERKLKETGTCLTHVHVVEDKRFLSSCCPCKEGWLRQACQFTHSTVRLSLQHVCAHCAHACCCFCTWIWKCRNVCMQVLLWVSVHIIFPEALDSCQATVAGSSALGLAATEQILPPVCGFDQQHRSVTLG